MRHLGHVVANEVGGWAMLRPLAAEGSRDPLPIRAVDEGIVASSDITLQAYRRQVQGYYGLLLQQSKSYLDVRASIRFLRPDLLVMTPLLIFPSLQHELFPHNDIFRARSARSIGHESHRIAASLCLKLCLSKANLRTRAAVTCT